MYGIVAIWPKHLPPLWIFFSLLETFCNSQTKEISISKQQDINHGLVCVCIRDRGLGRRVWKTRKQENQSAKSTGVERNPVTTCWEHIDSLESDYVLSVSISPPNWLQHLIHASKILGQWQINTTHFFHHLKVIRIRALHAPEASN